MSSVSLKAIRSFFVGGETADIQNLPIEYRSMVLNGAPRKVDPNGEHTYGQMYVQEYRLSSPRHPYPVLLWHGGGMTGCTWETTPDGRPGWLWRFLEAGYDVLVSDAVERGRSSWAMFPQVYREPPVFRTKHEAWTTFRFGPHYDADRKHRIAFPGQRFPIDHLDDFSCQWVPRWPGHEAMAIKAYAELIDQVGACIVVAHSQGAGYAAEVARQRPADLKAVVCVEPGGMPEPSPSNQLPPHLTVWGDFIIESGSHWITYRQQADRYIDAIKDCARTHTLDLPRIGITGNSHFPMMDRNSDQVFDLVLDWIQQ